MVSVHLGQEKGTQLEKKRDASLFRDSVPVQVATMFKVAPTIFRDMWRTPRGRDYAQRIACRNFSFGDHFRVPVFLTLYQKLDQDALPAKLAPEQDALLWNAITDTFTAYAAGKLDQIKLMQLGLSWKGTSNFLGWGGLAPKLDPALRGPYAYLMGHRYLRLNKPAEAVTFFRSALTDAGPNAPLRTLAQMELDRLNKK